MQKKILVTLVTLLFVLSACSPAAATHEAMMETPTVAMMDKPTDAMMETPTVAMMDQPTDDMMGTPTVDMMGTPTDAMSGDAMMTPSFFNISLSDVNTGNSFKISDFIGKVVLVEDLAMWCPSCKVQQEQVKILNEKLGMHSDLISVGLDVDPMENAANLKKYTYSNSFDWVYAIAPLEVTNEISKLYGVNFLNPPSTPIFIIDRKGEVHVMPFGIKSAEDLQKFIDPFLAEGM